MVRRGQIARAVGGRAALDPARGVGQDDEGGEVAILGPQAVADPAPQARPTHEGRAGVHLIDRLRVVHAVGPARADHGQVVDQLGRVREEVGDLDTALAVFPEGPFRRQQRVLRDLPTGRDRAEAARQGLAGEALEVGLGVEGFEVTGAAVHEQRDHPTSLGREVGGFRRERVGGVVGQEGLALEQPGRGQGAKAIAGLAEEVPPRRFTIDSHGRRQASRFDRGTGTNGSSLIIIGGVRPTSANPVDCQGCLKVLQGSTEPPTPTLPRKEGGSQTQANLRLFWLPPPLRGRVGVGGIFKPPETLESPRVDCRERLLAFNHRWTCPRRGRRAPGARRGRPA